MHTTVIIPTHNPQTQILKETLGALRAQTMATSQWDLIIVDNASNPPIQLDLSWHPSAQIIREPKLGLTSARIAGFKSAQGELIAMVDDDNLLDPHYLQVACALMEAHPKMGAFGGKSVPRYEQKPADWWRPEFDSLIACRDLGDVSQISEGLYSAKLQRNEYPLCAPLGAGMVIRRTALQRWLDQDAYTGNVTDRRGGDLTSGGDNDIVLSIMQDQWEVGYFPSLSLTHIIPAVRIQVEYLSKLTRGISKSWVQVLHKHDACPWLAISGWTVPLRKLKAWFTNQAWSGPVEYIKWQGICGHFEGLASLPRH